MEEEAAAAASAGGRVGSRPSSGEQTKQEIEERFELPLLRALAH